MYKALACQLNIVRLKASCIFVVVICGLFSLSVEVLAANRPNIVHVFADDISAREFPMYRPIVWSDSKVGPTKDVFFRARTAVFDELAAEVCWVTQAWAATVCSPGRAMMMTGRYAHRHKWWTNGELGMVINDNGKRQPWPLYESSPLLIGHITQQAGYGTRWAGKTQMKGSDLQKFGFDEGCFTPGEQGAPDNPYTDFALKSVESYRGPPNEPGQRQACRIQHWPIRLVLAAARALYESSERTFSMTGQAKHRD